MRARIGGVDLGYDVRASGDVAVLLLHAFPFDRGMWTDTASELSRGYRVVSLDFRGFGESALGPGGHSLETLAHDAAALLDAVGIARAAVVGLSMGGYVALAFAKLHPGRLAALVLADTRASADTPEARRARDEGIALARTAGTAAFLDRSLPRLLSVRASDGLRARVRPLAQQPVEAIAAALAAMRDRPDRTAELGSIRCPALVLVGSDDAVTPPAEARAMAAAIPHARFVELPGAGHLANLEAPAAFNHEVTELLRTVPA